jgi:hypothetical protein
MESPAQTQNLFSRSAIVRYAVISAINLAILPELAELANLKAQKKVQFSLKVSQVSLDSPLAKSA